MSPISIELMRHGDTGQRSYRGQLDDPLTELGWQQLREGAANGEWDVLVSSSLQRCAAFARELAEQRGLPLQLDPRLCEYHFGDWQGVPIEEIDRDYGPALGRFWADPLTYPPPNAETFQQFQQRLCEAMDAIVASYPGKRVLVITHGGVIKLLRSVAAGQGPGSMAGMHVPHASLHPLPWPPR